ncbi:MAG: hypothetical protein VX642_08810 [Bdellovibrionota bacterium]|nr:hypothetical protein [Bdellovibrionota bacterium]
MDKPLISFLSFLLLIELAVLFADLGFLPAHLLPNSIRSLKQQNQKIGHISFLKNKVRKKLDQSIVWTEGKAQEELYNQDSVLTLKDSSAKIKLDGNIQIKLYENTLIVIKAPEQKHSEEGLKIQFAKGNLRSRLRDKKIALEAETWSFNPSENSDISFRSTADKKLEIEVNQGSIQIANKESPEKIIEFTEGKSLSLGNTGAIQSKSITSEFRWDYKEQQTRFYSSAEENSEIQLKWQGSPTKITLYSNSTGSKDYFIEGERKNMKLTLPPGHYFAKLEDEKKVSKTFEFEVLAAQYFSYYSPFPRDRILNQNEHLFSWEKIPNASKYKIEFSRNKNFENLAESYVSDENIKKLKVQNNGPLYWRVLAIDEKGGSYPNNLKFPIYSISEALAAPNLKGIQKSRIPASKQKSNELQKQKPSNLKPKKNKATDKIMKKDFEKTNSHYKEKTNKYLEREEISKNTLVENTKTLLQAILDIVFINQAKAEEFTAVDKETPKKYEYKFEWSKVDGADFYIIEISKSPNFQDLLFEDQSNETSIHWESEHTGKVFWRVSAGAYNGIMGVFSEAMEVNLSEIEVHKKVVQIKKTEIKAPIKSENEKVVKPPQIPLIASKKQKEEIDPQLTKISSHFSIAYFLSYGKAKGFLLEENARYNFTGVKPFEIEMQYTKKSALKKYYSSSLSYHRSEWKAETSSLSFQEKIKEEQIFWDHYFFFAGSWSFGINLQKREFPLRTGNETIDFSSKYLSGLSFQNEFKFNKASLPEILVAQSRLSANGEIIDISGKFLAKWKLKTSQKYQIHFDAGMQYNLRSTNAKDFSHYTEVQIGLSIDWGSFPKSQDTKQNERQ